jgi:hypothetical protein
MMKLFLSYLVSLSISCIFYPVNAFLFQNFDLQLLVECPTSVLRQKRNHRQQQQQQQQQIIVTTRRMAESSSSSCSSSTTDITNQKKKRALYSFSEARKVARGHGFSSKEEFMNYVCPGAYQLPKNPEEVWSKDWASWDDFLGIPLDFEEARKVARGLVNVETEMQYLNLFKEKKLSEDGLESRLPYRPDLKYKSKWISWDDFLIKD